MKILSKYLTTVGVASILGLSTAATAATDLTMYYPVAVGGSLTKIVDGMVDQFEAQTLTLMSMQSMQATTMTHVSKHWRLCKVALQPSCQLCSRLISTNYATLRLL